MAVNDWPYQSECLEMFGNPSEPGWAAKWLVPIALPFTMQMDEITVRSVQVNKIAAPSLSRIFTNIWNACGHDIATVRKCGCGVYSGCWAVRPIRGGRAPSMHSFGLAIDINAPANPLGVPPSRALFKQDSVVVKAFKQEGWIWGGDWRGRPDCMHFQCVHVG